MALHNCKYFLKYCYVILLSNIICQNIVQRSCATNDFGDFKQCNTSARPGCQFYRELECQNNYTGFDCTNSNEQLGATYEVRLSFCSSTESSNCSGRPMPCQGNCYDATQVFQRICDHSNGCVSVTSEYRRCYNSNNCSETWSNWSPVGNCSAPCGGGLQRETRFCRDFNGKVYLFFYIILTCIYSKRLYFF